MGPFPEPKGAQTFRLRQEEWDYGPDSDFYDDLDGARWAGFMNWSEAKFNAAVEARQAYMFTYLDARPLEQRPDDRAASFRRPIAPSRQWQAVVEVHREQELAKFDQRVAEWNERRWPQQPRLQRQQQRQQDAGAASKKQKL
jgi:hypothetical protein